MLEKITDDLIADLEGLTFGPPVTHVYNPLVYARDAWDMYCKKYGRGRREVLMLGMNPGPWGMSQVGVPFGEIASVREWLRVEAPIGKPDNEHPKRPILGFECPRSEVSGRRLWGWAKDTYKTPKAFFRRFFVANYCPLVFMEEGGRNRVPEKLPKAEREPVFAACDEALLRTIEHFSPKYIIGVGKFAEKKAKAVVGDRDIVIGSIPHPSPASPLANRGWSPLVAPALEAVGLEV
jgi:single-strand selective monofunctional uracil DNA glycosylase